MFVILIEWGMLMPATTPPDAASASPASPQQIGHYQVIAKIGEGGMGVVYRAHDTKLNRDVAIKVLPLEFAEDPYRMARFEREAQLLASLNHPKIAAIYGLEESGPTRALVMELVEGPTLAERIGRTTASGRPKAGSGSQAQATASGPKSAERSGSAARAHKTTLPMDEALPIAQQVAEALDYAHEHGIIHRDLKPANIKVTPDGCVKVLDFGLAKALLPEEASGNISNSPTLSLAMSEAGFIMGTAAYMAPEQAKGKQVDRRADIWAFGCVLYEMLTGHKAFEGETVSDVIASVLKSEPDWSALPETTPAAIQKLLRHCLVKDPKQRLRDIGDARIAIEENLSGADVDTAVFTQISAPKRASFLRRALPWALGAVAIIFAGLAAWLVRQPKPPQNVIRFSVPEPANGAVRMKISPDGRMLVFAGSQKPDSPPVLWLRPLDSLTAQPIPGTEGTGTPFWSPDSQQIGFDSAGKLQKISISGGAPIMLCEAKDFRGGTWSRDGVILFASDRSLYRVSDTGGTPTLVLAPDPARRQMAYSSPQFLPDGQHFLVEVNTPGTDVNIIAAGSVGSKTLVHLMRISSQPVYTPPGYLFYLDQTTLMARPFDAGTLHFTGSAVPIAQSVGESVPGLANFSVSRAGVLAYGDASIANGRTPGQMTWFDRTGKKVGTVGQPGINAAPALSPDGTRVAAAAGEVSAQDIWIYDLKRGTASRLTFNPANDTNPTWSPDGSQILFSSTRNGPYGIYQKAPDGLGSTQLIFQSSSQAAAINDVSADGRYIIYDTAIDPAAIQLWVLPLFGDRKPFVFVQGSFGASSAKFSPDSHCVAYVSRETGRQEVYVQTFPQSTGRWQISTSGGTQPMWRRDGKELFYLAPVDTPSEIKIMSVSINSGSVGFQAGIPKELFQTPVVPLWYWRNVYVPSPDGQKFLIITPTGQTKPSPITVVVNWPSLLKK